ncbi:hypothetical protein ACXVUM_07405 [Williamsia sp. SKLECPSW1]
MDVEPAHLDTPGTVTDPHTPGLVYSFGDGDGTVHTWTSAADRDLSGDGVPDALTLDFDGDGRRDDVMWDSDGDGRADLAGLDVDDTGVGRYYSDTGRGLWDHRVHDVAPSPAPPVHAEPAPPEPTSPDGVGLVFPAGSESTPVRVLLDLDGDEVVDAALADVDADGVADRWLVRGDADFTTAGGREDQPLRSAGGRREERG